jgi:hypothetical protein
MAEQLFGLTAADVAAIKDMRSRIAGAAGSFSGTAARSAPPINPTYQTLDGTFKGQWAKGAKKKVKTAGGELEAINHIATISAPSTDPGGPCAIAWNGYEWCVVAPFGGGGVELGRCSAAWPKGAVASIALYSGAAGGESATGEVVQAANYVGDVAENRWVLVAKSGSGAWYLVAPELTKTQFVWTVLQDSRGLVFRRKSAWMLTPEEDIDDVIPTTDCVIPYLPKEDE